MNAILTFDILFVSQLFHISDILISQVGVLWDNGAIFV